MSNYESVALYSPVSLISLPSHPTGHNIWLIFPEPACSGGFLPVEKQLFLRTVAKCLLIGGSSSYVVVTSNICSPCLTI